MRTICAAKIQEPPPIRNPVAERELGGDHHRAGGEQGIAPAVVRDIGERVRAGKSLSGEIDQRGAVADCDVAVGGLRNGPQNSSAHSGSQDHGNAAEGRSSCAGERRRHIGGAGIVVSGAIVAIEAANLFAAPECDGLNPAGVERVRENRAVGLDARKHGAGQVRAMTRLAACAGVAGITAVAGVPIAAHRVHAVRAGVGPGIGNRPGVTDGAFNEHADMALVLNAGNVVVGKRAGKFGVGRAVAAGASHTAVAGREPEQRYVRRRHIRRRGKGVCAGDIDAGLAEHAVGERRRVSDLAAVDGGGAGVAGLTVRLLEPAGPVRGAHCAHIAVAALALHRHRAVHGIDGLAHRAAQTAGDRAGMTRVTGEAIVFGVECQAAARVNHRRMLAVDRGGELRNVEQRRERQRLGKVALGANKRFLVNHHRREETGGIEIV